MNKTSVKIFKKINESLIKVIQSIIRNDHANLIFYSVIIGTAVGLSVVFFHNSIEFFNEVFFRRTAEGLFFLGATAVIAFPAIGMLIQSIMILIAPETSKNRGVAEIIKAVGMHGKLIPFRTTVFHFLAPVISIGSGGTVGPEAPAAQLGGGVANKLAHLFKVTETRRKVFTAAGSGAAIAAIFNTPLGGIFFALEVILLNEFQATTFSALVLSSVTASAISRIFLGNKSVFIFHTPNVGTYDQFYIYALLGLVAGFISILFIQYSNALDNFLHSKILKKYPQMLVMVFIGLLVGIAGFFFEDIFGIGYAGINHILSSMLTWKIVLILFLLKFILVPLILNSGGFGGIFAPSLFMGACFGWLSAWVLNSFLGFNVDPTAFILVSMGAMLGGINSIPIASILIIFEMTQDYSFILPLMLSIIASTMIVRIILKRSLQEQHLEKQGYRIAVKSESNLLRSIKVKQVMSKDAVIIPEETPLPKVLSRFIESSHSTFYTINTKGELSGTIIESELRPIIMEYEHIREVLVARDIASHEVFTVSETEDLDYVMTLFESRDSDEFPVVSASDKNKILGTIRRHEVISAYNKEKLKSISTEEFTRELKLMNKLKCVNVFGNYSIAERKVPGEFHNKSLIKLNLPKKYGIKVLLVKKPQEKISKTKEDSAIIPAPDYVFSPEDIIIIFGEKDKVELTERWDF